jgi:hypothetical protein
MLMRATCAQQPATGLLDYINTSFENASPGCEELMTELTWFTEGSTGGSFRNPGTTGEGLLERYGITALVQELNANWIESLKQPTSGSNWVLLGSQYREIFSDTLNRDRRGSEFDLQK